MDKKEQKSEIENIIQHHHYPDWLMAHPPRIDFYYRLLRIFYLRSRICRRHLHQLLDGQNPGSYILDVGCGEGQFLIPAVRQYPGLFFTGMDQLKQHIDFLQNLIRTENLQNIKLIKGNIETQVISPVPVDLIYIISVLQYTQHPEQLIRRFHAIQPPGGKLMIYTPVGPSYSVSFARKIKKKYSHYDSAQPYFHPLDEEDLFRWIGSAGYSVLEERYYYSRWAAFSHETIQTLIILFTHWPVIFKIIPLVILLLFSPIFVSLQVIDEFFKPKRGNGLLLILQKKK